MAKKTMTAIEYVEQLIKEEKMPELKRTNFTEYEMDFFNRKIIFRSSITNRNRLVLEHNSMAVSGVSMQRIRKICKSFCDEEVTVKSSGGNISFRCEASCSNVDDVRCAIMELMDTVKCFAEEVNLQTMGNCTMIDADRLKAIEEQAKKQKKDKNDDEEEETNPYCRFKRSKNGDGFKAVAGMSDLKTLLNRDFIHTIVCKELAGDYGITPPNGILLYGPPGCGKTYIAERLAEETHIKYALIKPSDIGSTFVHGSEERINMLFKEAEENAPCLLIFDEFDALAPSRDIAGSECQSEEINEFLVHLNNCAERGVYVIAMSNHPERIDRAILRKGRMDKCIYVPAPDDQTRAQIFNLSLNHRLCSNNIDLFELARLTEGYSSSDISYIVQETARTCFEETLSKRMNNRKRISQADLKRTIENTLPSISATDLKKYDKVREELNDRQFIKCGRRKLGF